MYIQKQYGMPEATLYSHRTARVLVFQFTHMMDCIVIILEFAGGVVLLSTIKIMKCQV